MAAARRPILWSPEALADLDAIWDHYARVAGRSTADKLLRDIGSVVSLIADQPFAGRARDEVRPGIRSFAASSHVVFYRVQSDTPQVVRVLDGRQDIEEIFGQGDDG